MFPNSMVSFFLVALVFQSLPTCSYAQEQTVSWMDLTATLSGGINGPSGLVLRRDQRAKTKGSFAPPVEIEYICETDSYNIRLCYACDQLIFNWEGNPNELRVDGGPVHQQNRAKAGRVPVKTFLTIHQVVNKDSMKIFVDNHLRGEWKADFSRINSPISVFTVGSATVTVKSIKVRQPPVGGSTSTVALSETTDTMAIVEAELKKALDAAQASPTERLIIGTDLGPADIIARQNIILVWPKHLAPEWYTESRVSNPQQMADWLEAAYCFAAKWARFNPNDYYAFQNKERIRLVFLHNDASYFTFGGKRPYIGLRQEPAVGSEDWFGFLAHEMSHDFWHEHPAFKRVKSPWGEAMCDYQRYALLLNTGMPEAAQRWERLLQRAAPDDCYRGGAWMLLRFQRDHKLDGPLALWNFLWDKDFAANVGKPLWDKPKR